MRRCATRRLGIPSWPHAAGTVRGASRQPWRSRAAGHAARHPVLPVLGSRVRQHGRRLNQGKKAPAMYPTCLHGEGVRR
jgi:hypothetical protein